MWYSSLQRLPRKITLVEWHLEAQWIQLTMVDKIVGITFLHVTWLSQLYSSLNGRAPNVAERTNFSNQKFGVPWFGHLFTTE